MIKGYLIVFSSHDNQIRITAETARNLINGIKEGLEWFEWEGNLYNTKDILRIVNYL
jgi:hypothetical protein